MKHALPYKYFFQKPKTGWKNLLMSGICSMLPVVGPIVILGYRKKVFDVLEHDPELRDYPDFDFNKFAEYLGLGVWAFLDQILVGIAFAIPFYIAYFGTFFGMMAAGFDFLLAYFIALAWVIPLSLMYVILWPMEIHAMKKQKFNPIADFRFAVKFLRKVWVETFVSVIVSNTVLAFLLFIGLLLCYFGAFFTLTIYSMAVQHLMVQLYQAYIEEGGEPLDEEILLKSEDDGPISPAEPASV